MDEEANESTVTLQSLKKECRKLERAHKQCRSINGKLHNFLGITILVSSAGVTCLETLVDYTIHDSYIHIVRVCLASLVTCLSAISQFFQNSAKSEKHHAVSRQYLSLSIEIDKSLIKNEADVLEKLDNFNKIRSESIGLFSCVRKQNNIS